MDLRQESEQKHPTRCLAALSQSKTAILVFGCIPLGFPSPAIPTKLLPASSAVISVQCATAAPTSLLPWQGQAVGLGHTCLYLGPQTQTQPQASLCFFPLYLEVKHKNKSAELSALQIHRQSLQTPSKNEKSKAERMARCP